jgi:hypothetical protein
MRVRTRSGIGSRGRRYHCLEGNSVFGSDLCIQYHLVEGQAEQRFHSLPFLVVRNARNPLPSTI